MAMYIFYPSCNFKKWFPETAAKIRAYMEKQSDVKIADCCQKTFDIPQEGDIVITICNSCMHLLEELTKHDNKIISFFEFLLTRNDFQWPDYAGEEITLQDCFRARGKHEFHDAVRTCMKNMNIQVIEMEHNRDEEDFDGRFRFNNPYPQNQRDAPKYFLEYLPKYVTLKPEEEWVPYFKEYVKKITTEKVVTYCNTCTTGLKQGGAETYHLAELLFR